MCGTNLILPLQARKRKSGQWQIDNRPQKSLSDKLQARKRKSSQWKRVGQSLVLTRESGEGNLEEVDVLH